MDCLNSPSEELEKLHLNAHSLKLRFAAIHNCFMEINVALDKQMTEAISKPLPTFDEPTESQIRTNSMRFWRCQNEFRCYAHRRIDYYNAQKGAGDLQHRLCLAMAQRCHEDSGAEAF